MHTERADLENWQSGQDHIALYMYNCNEYMEAMLGAFKCRACAVNVNYRYKEDELVYLLNNSESSAIVYHTRFAPMLEGIRERLPHLRLWIQVDDGSGEGLLDGAFDYEEALAATDAQPTDPAASSDDLYIVYTGGTTGMPKGVLWRQEDMLFSSLFLSAVYAESLMICCALAALWLARRDRPWLAGVAAALCTLSRPIGFLIVIALFDELAIRGTLGVARRRWRAPATC